MEIPATYETGKVIVAKGRLWRGVMITETLNGYIVQDENGRGYFFTERQAALDFVDRLFENAEA